MVDSTSKPTNVVPLFTDETSGNLPPPGGGGDGEDYGPQIEKLESDISEIKKLIKSVNKNMSVLNNNMEILKKRTRYFDRSVSHKELIGWAVGFLLLVGGSYAYVTPFVIKAYESGELKSINEKLSVISDGIHTQPKQE